MTPSGIEPATFRFVAQRLNHCATAVPRFKSYGFKFMERPHKQAGVTAAMFFRDCFTPLSPVVREVTWLWHTWETRTVGQAATTTGIVVEAYIQFQKEENTTNTCRPALLQCTKMPTMTLRHPTPMTPHPYNRVVSQLVFIN